MRAKETALLLIEFQNEFCKAGGKLHDAVKGEIERQGVIDNACKVTDAARHKGCLVVHSPFVFDRDWVEAHAVGGIIAEAGKAGAFRPGEWGTQIIDELSPRDADLVLEGKKALSAFAYTDLQRELEERGIKDTVVMGFVNNGCVEATARSAYDYGYRVTLIKDAVAGTDPDNQVYLEREIVPIIGQAMTADEFVTSLE